MKTVDEIKQEILALGENLADYPWGDLPVDDELRTFVCGLGDREALSFATEVDKGPHDETRKAVSGHPVSSILYAIFVDKGPHDETRSACCADAEYSLKYAEDVDKCPTDETRTGAYADPFYKRLYICVFGE